MLVVCVITNGINEVPHINKDFEMVFQKKQ